MGWARFTAWVTGEEMTSPPVGTLFLLGRPGEAGPVYTTDIKSMATSLVEAGELIAKKGWGGYFITHKLFAGFPRGP